MLATEHCGVSASGPSPLNLTNVARFRSDYSEVRPPDGWRYMWNRLGPIGDSDGYVDMGWNGSVYELSSDPDYPSAAPASYLLLDGFGGHPGLGSSQSGGVENTLSRYVILSYTVSKTGPYWLANSFVYRHDGALNGSDVVRVYVNDVEIGAGLVFESNSHQTFDRELGMLRAGDAIVVAVGPNGSDVNDSFGIDFAIATLPPIDLAVQRSGTETALAWPFFPTALPESAPEVLGPWELMKEAVYQVDGRHRMNILPSEPRQFFRLRVVDPGPPTIVRHPESQTVAAGESVTFSVTVTNTAALPISYRWRKGARTLEIRELNQYSSAFTISKVQADDAGSYEVVVTNAVFYTPGFRSDSATLVVE